MRHFGGFIKNCFTVGKQEHGWLVAILWAIPIIILAYMCELYTLLFGIKKNKNIGG